MCITRPDDDPSDTHGVFRAVDSATDDSPVGDSLVRLRLDLGYDGTDFSGWAVQPHRRTVAGVLTGALETLFAAHGAPPPHGLTVAGRTDAGVHATGQVCHVDVVSSGWDRLATHVVKRLAGLLPPDVRVYAVTPVPVSFDARFGALFRRYEYRVTDAVWGAGPLRRRDTLAWHRPLAIDALVEAARGLVGEHDFAAYCRRKDDATTVRAIRDLSWRRDGEHIFVATVEADAFCQAMVRSLVGALLAVGDGRRPMDWPASLLARRQRADEVVVAPAHGLTLVAVGYPPPEQYATRAEATRRRRDPVTLAS